ncbi:MAG: hypothetical protein ACI9DF_004504, partial [Verrucomicrobiales bacterium]
MQMTTIGCSDLLRALLRQSYLVLFFSACVPVSWALTGGSDAEIETYPWMAALLNGKGKPAGSSHFCGGSLIHPSWVMTAAHCVLDRSANDFEVAFGLDGLNAEVVGERYSVVEIVIHPRYLFRNGSIDGDVALLRLDRPVEDREPIRLFERAVLTEMDAQAVGWDERLGGRSFTQLSLNLLTRLEAQKATLDAGIATGNGFYLDNIPVYSGAETKGVCYGDSGGPLLIREGTQWQLAGVTSYVVGNCVGYAAYSELQPHLDWVIGHVYPGFDAWREDHLISTVWGDEDNDGFTNFLEFARLSDPQDPSLSSTFVDAFLNPAGRPAFRFGHRQDVDFQVERSADLLSWARVEPADIQKTSAADGSDVVTALGRGSLADGAPEFLRVLSSPSYRSSKPNRSDFRELYVKGDADLAERNETGHLNKVYHVSNLPPGLATFNFQAPFFIPYLKLLDRDSGEVVLEAAGSANSHNLISSVVTESDKDYTLVLSSIESPPTGWFTFH